MELDVALTESPPLGNSFALLQTKVDQAATAALRADLPTEYLCALGDLRGALGDLQNVDGSRLRAVLSATVDSLGGSKPRVSRFKQTLKAVTKWEKGMASSSKVVALGRPFQVAGRGRGRGLMLPVRDRWRKCYHCGKFVNHLAKDCPEVCGKVPCPNSRPQCVNR
jgi:hypothetical protein